jgi:hypothetical protein
MPRPKMVKSRSAVAPVVVSPYIDSNSASMTPIPVQT